MPRFYLQTLGCAKNAVDSDKIVGTLLADGLEPARGRDDADLVVLNTCAFVEEARRESIDSALTLAEAKRRGARLIVTGCLAERYADELASALAEADAVVGFAGATTLSEFSLAPPRRKPVGVRDLLELPRPAPCLPWAYLRVAEGCDRACAFCAIPSFRGAQRSRTPEAIEAEARALVEGGVVELVLVAQDLASYGRDVGKPGALVPLLRRLDRLAPHGLERMRLLYLYPSEVRDPLVAAMLDTTTVVAYFDLSLQHASARLLRSMKRWGSHDRFASTIEAIRAAEPAAAFRSSFIVGFPGESEADHEELLTFLSEVRLDWAGFFPYSAEDGTTAAAMSGVVDDALCAERLRECGDIQDRVTAAARDALVGTNVEVLVDGQADDTLDPVGRTHREAPEIDGIVRLAGATARPGTVISARIIAAAGPDLIASPLGAVGGV